MNSCPVVQAQCIQEGLEHARPGPWRLHPGVLTLVRSPSTLPCDILSEERWGGAPLRPLCVRRPGGWVPTEGKFGFAHSLPTFFVGSIHGTRVPLQEAQA